MKILIGYDGSIPAEAAIRDLVHAGLPAKADIRILMVVRPWIPPESEQGLSESRGWFSKSFIGSLADAKAAEREAEKIAGKGRKFLATRFPGWKVHASVTIAAPVHGLLDLAKAWKPDLIVVGSHSRSPIGKLILGSVARKVLEHADCPVRIGRSSRGKRTAPPRLLIGMDGSSDSEKSVRAVARRRWPRGTEVRILTVLDFVVSYKESVRGKREIRTAREIGNTWQWMEKLQAESRSVLKKSGVKVSTLILQGAAPQSILEEAGRFKADTIFLGSRGLSSLGRFLLGGVSAAVAMRSSCSVETHGKTAKTPSSKGKMALPPPHPRA